MDDALMDQFSSQIRHYRVALVSALELANLADQALVIAHSAVARTESRGAPRITKSATTPIG
jgi:succinate dehydrogenase/fumarate reductase flavoprotein subunit